MCEDMAQTRARLGRRTFAHFLPHLSFVSTESDRPSVVVDNSLIRQVLGIYMSLCLAYFGNLKQLSCMNCFIETVMGLLK